MPAEAAPSINERQFVRQALAQNIRLDGRALDAFRSIEIQFGDDYGTVSLSWGKTKVLTKISCEVVAPYPDRKFDGVFQIACELSPMTSPAVESGRLSLHHRDELAADLNSANEAETLLARHLETAIRRSRALDTESLCVSAGHTVFAVRADVHIMSSDGALLDAACLCVVTALSHFRRPDVSVQGEKVTVHSLFDRNPVALSMLHHPFCVTLSIFSLTDQPDSQDSDGMVVVDANLLESQLADGEMVMTANKTGEVCQITKRGGLPADALSIMGWIEIGVRKAKELDKIMRKALDEDAKKRDADGLMAELRADNDR